MTDKKEVHQVRYGVAVGADCTLGLASRTRGVEHGRIVVGLDLNVRGRGPLVDRTEEILVRHDVDEAVLLVDVRRPFWIVADDDDGLKVGQAIKLFEEPIETLFIYEQHRRAGVI